MPVLGVSDAQAVRPVQGDPQRAGPGRSGAPGRLARGQFPAAASQHLRLFEGRKFHSGWPRVICLPPSVMTALGARLSGSALRTVLRASGPGRPKAVSRPATPCDAGVERRPVVLVMP